MNSLGTTGSHNPWSQSQWSLSHPTKISFGIRLLESLATRFSEQKILLVTSSGWIKRGLANKILSTLEKNRCTVKTLALESSNPNFRDIKKLLAELADFSPDTVLAVGGGSVMDLAKALAVLCAQPKLEFSEFQKAVKTADKTFNPKTLPLITVATTSGTGSEVTPFATVWDDEEKKKYSLVGPQLHPTEAWLDPTLALPLPWDVTLATGMDALSQCIESVWNKNAHPLLIPQAARGVQLALTALPKLQNDLSNLEARSQMMESSLISGICISHTRTALAHAISYPLTAHYGTPHGLACSFTLPALWELNLKADDGRLNEFCKMMGILPTEFATTLRELIQKSGFAAEFKKSVFQAEQVFSKIDEMFTPGRADNNLSPVGHAEIKIVLKSSLKDLGIN